MEDTLIGSVIDNGVGFDTENQRLKHLKDSKLGGFGIYGMKQRAELLKGRLNIKSQPGKGTTLRLEIPLNALGKERVMNMIRVMIADDHSLMRKGLQQILELEDDIKVIAQAKGGQRRWSWDWLQPLILSLWI